MSEVASETQVATESSAEQGAQETGVIATPGRVVGTQVMLVSFESGHYKKIIGGWKGDSRWTHWVKPDGKQIHINKNKVEYYEEVEL